MDISGLPVMLTILGLVTKEASCTHSRAVKEMKDSKDVMASQQPETPYTPVTFKQHLQIVGNEWHRRMWPGDIPPTDK